MIAILLDISLDKIMIVGHTICGKKRILGCHTRQIHKKIFITDITWHYCSSFSCIDNGSNAYPHLRNEKKIGLDFATFFSPVNQISSQSNIFQCFFYYWVRVEPSSGSLEIFFSFDLVHSKNRDREPKMLPNFNFYL